MPYGRALILVIFVTLNVPDGDCDMMVELIEKQRWATSWSLVSLKIEKLRNSTGILSLLRMVRLTLSKVIMVPLLTDVLSGAPGFNLTAVAGGIRTNNIRVISDIDMVRLPIFFNKFLFSIHPPSTTSYVVFNNYECNWLSRLYYLYFP